MDKLQAFNFQQIYQLAGLIETAVKYEEHFWNYNEEYFINAATRFSKETLLHQYIVITAFNHYSRELRKNGDFVGEGVIENWHELFTTYSIPVVKIKIDFEDFDAPFKWFEDHQEQLLQLFDKMAQETFHLLFSNRMFLLAFVELASETIRTTTFPAELVTKKGTIRRVVIPQWVRKAIFHRDKGRCVFCNTDLTGLVNTLTASNYDHILPLDLFGPNDPCNIQLTCERCNKVKNATTASTTTYYMPWW